MSISITQIIQDELKNAFGSEADKITKEDIILSLKLGDQLAEGNVRVKDILNISNEHMEILYTVAFESYDRKKFEDAYKTFMILCVYDPSSIKYWEGLGASQKMLKKYDEAIMSYFMLTQLHALKISYFLDLAECFLKLGQKDPCMKCCEAIIFMAQDSTYRPKNKDADECLQKANKLLTLLKK